MASLTQCYIILITDKSQRFFEAKDLCISNICAAVNVSYYISHSLREVLTYSRNESR